MTDGKKDWREIDQARIRGIKTEKSVSKQEERAQKTASHAAKKELESLFSGSKISKDKKAQIDGIQKLRGRPEYYSEMTKYITDFGVPLDFETQMLFLDHRDKAVVIQILEEMKRMASKMDLEKQSLLAQKLKVMVLSTFDPDLAAKIKELETSMLR